MVMELKLEMRMLQQMVMTPQLQLAIKMLQMTRLELVDSIHQEMMENPVLEEQSEIVHEKETQNSLTADWSIDANPPTIEQATERESRALPDAQIGAEKNASEIDWEKYLENRNLQKSLGWDNSRGREELPNYEGTLTKRTSLSDHLLWQAQMSDFVANELRFTELVVGNLDERGYLTIEGVPSEEVVSRLAKEADIFPDDAEEVLKIIQLFDPIGVAARDLKECLLVQAEYFGMDTLVLDVLRNHIHDLERKDYHGIAKALDIPLEEVYDVAQVIAELEPRPARNYLTEDPHYIIPDVYVHKVGEQFFVVANDDGMPKLKISGYYRSAMQGDKKAKEYIKDKLRSAQWLIRSIDQRRKTIERVTECIVEEQHDFFEKGIEYLKPMILRDVADKVGMHESTVSRVTSKKYVHTPRGLFELKFFFNAGIRRSNADDIASKSVQQAIKKIVQLEDTGKPTSDQKILELLAKDGVVIARRTVTKYREGLGILSSAKRKKYF
jgi:RNA polymerase sigma-54 factor